MHSISAVNLVLEQCLSSLLMHAQHEVLNNIQPNEAVKAEGE